MSEAPVLLGHISGVHGVSGWVSVYSFTVPREAIVSYRHWLIKRSADWVPIQVMNGRRQGKSVIAQLDGVSDRDQAGLLIGAEIAVERTQLPDLDATEYYWADLEGLRVEHIDGTCLGTVAYLLETGANDVLVTRGDRERLIPFVIGTVVENVDLAAGRITVNWPPDWDRD